MNEAKKQQVIALGRLGWSLRRIQKSTGVRRETAATYLREAGVALRPPGAWGRTAPAKPANEVATGSAPARASNSVGVADYCEAFGEKVDNIANYIKSQEYSANNARREIVRLQSRATTADNRAERLKGLVKYFMQARNVRSLKGRLNTISLRNNSQDSLIINQRDAIPAEYWRVSVTMGLAEWQDLLDSLPEQHQVRARFAAGDGGVSREPDNAKLRAALASGVRIENAELRRGRHIRLT